MYTRPSYTATPRLTGPQQCTVTSNSWAYSHFLAPVAASSATTWFSGVDTYIVPPTTTGLASNECGIPVL